MKKRELIIEKLNSGFISTNEAEKRAADAEYKALTPELENFITSYGLQMSVGEQVRITVTIEKLLAP